MTAFNAEADMRASFDRVFHDSSLNEVFSRDGFVIVDFLDGSGVDELLEVWRSRPDPARMAYTSTAFSPDIDLRNELSESIQKVFAGPAGALLDGYRMCLAGFIRKRSSDASGTVELHQDPSIVDESQFVSVNIWCPLVDVSLRNGCLKVVPGSHVINRGPRAHLNLDFPYDELCTLIEANCVLDIPMKAGQAFVYTQALFHGSSPNLSDRERVVAGCMTAPERGKLMIFTKAPDAHRGQLAAYAVSDEYYREYRLGTEPPEQFSIGFVDDAYGPVEARKLAALAKDANANRPF